jgi:hypothetical protein
MSRYAITAGWLKRKRQERGFPSAVALGRAASLTISHASILERGDVQPRPETFRRLAKALKLTPVEQSEFRNVIAADGAPRDRSSLQLWTYLPACLLTIEHDGSTLFELFADGWLVDAVRGAGSLLGWLGLLSKPPTRQQISRMRAAALRVFDASSRRAGTYQGNPAALGARDAASLLPVVWRNELFARPEATLRLVSLLSKWVYVPRPFRSSAAFGLWFQDQSLNLAYSVDSASVDTLRDIHDAMLAHRLWLDLELTAACGVAGESHQQRQLARFGGRVGEIQTLLSGPDDLIRSRFAPGSALDRLSPGELAMHKELAWLEYRAAAERLDLAFRLYELPDLAASVLRYPQPDSAESPRPLPRNVLESALAKARDLVGGFSVRFPNLPVNGPKQ